MNHNALAAAAFAFLAAAPAASQDDVNPDDIVIFVMQDMDGAVEDLEPFIGAHDAAGATEAAQFLVEGLQWTEDYFASKGDREDGVGFARDARVRAGDVVDAINAGNFTAAAEAAREVAKACRTCHDVYRP